MKLYQLFLAAAVAGTLAACGSKSVAGTTTTAPELPAAPEVPAASGEDAEVTIYLVRHGKTFFNTTDQVQGWADSPLTEKGES